MADSRRIKTEGRLKPDDRTALWVGGHHRARDPLLHGAHRTPALHQPRSCSLVGSLACLIYPAMGWLARRRSRLQAGRSAEAIFEFLERKPSSCSRGGAQFLPPLQSRISFENVTLESRSVPRLARRGVGGDSGGLKDGHHEPGRGHETRPGLSDPQVDRSQGSAACGSTVTTIREVTLESIRAQVATVLQADLVFTDSVAVNIGLGEPGYPLPKIIEAAKVAHAHTFIQELPHAYDTIIGQLGHYLRLDEQYRIALARAYLHDPSIVIIEEPNIALDDDTKHLIDDTISASCPRAVP